MSSRLPAHSGAFQRAALALLLVGACGCTNSFDDFVGARVLDSCNGSWPVCNTIATCYIGPESYIQGRFPGSGKVIVLLAQPSSVNVSFLFADISSVGNTTTIIWNEAGCRANSRVDVPGTTVASEANTIGVFERSMPLLDAGEHLISFQSDLEATYTMKVDVVPTVL